jgi:hypothetical protein
VGHRGPGRKLRVIFLALTKTFGRDGYHHNDRLMRTISAVSVNPRQVQFVAPLLAKLRDDVNRFADRPILQIKSKLSRKHGSNEYREEMSH